MKNFRSFTIVCMTALAFLPAAVRAAELPVADFSSAENQKLGWKVVDDGVMGGLSKGAISFKEEGILRFSGELSLDNNGGFSSLRTDDLTLDLSGSEGLVARVKGDGRTYQMRLGTDARYRGMEVSFMAGFSTEKGEWTEVRIPFGNFVGSWRGLTLKDEVFDPAKIRRLGLLLGDKQAGPFELQIDWIKAYGSGTGDVVEKALADGRFKTLAAALTQADLVSDLKGDGPFTVFAPADEAFATLPDGTLENLLKPENKEQLRAILKFHVVPGAVKLGKALELGEAATLQGDSLAITFSEGKVLVNKAAVINADIECSNGVIHVINSVLLPPAPTGKVIANDIPGVAKRAGNFGTLLAAVEASGLSSVLAGEGPFTILAPTDEAFARLPKGTIETLLKEENRDQLKAILTCHAFAGRISAGDALNAKTVKTINGNSVEFGIQHGLLKANGATIRSTDIACDNGIIHAIDAVLLPPSAKTDAEDSQPASVEPAKCIEDAISRGVPAFNQGDPAACAEIYKACLENLTKNEQVAAPVRKIVEKVLDQAGAMENARDRAWRLRQGLDDVYQTLAE